MSIRQGNSLIAGMTRVLLYDNTGNNQDGAMTQKATTTAINNAKEALEGQITNLDNAKQNNLTAGTNIVLANDEVSTTASQCIIREW